MTNRRRNLHERRARLLAAERLAERRTVLPFNVYATIGRGMSVEIADGCYRTLPLPTEE